MKNIFVQICDIFLTIYTFHNEHNLSVSNNNNNLKTNSKSTENSFPKATLFGHQMPEECKMSLIQGTGTSAAQCIWKIGLNFGGSYLSVQSFLLLFIHDGKPHLQDSVNKNVVSTKKFCRFFGLADYTLVAKLWDYLAYSANEKYNPKTSSQWVIG